MASVRFDASAFAYDELSDTDDLVEFVIINVEGVDSPMIFGLVPLALTKVIVPLPTLTRMSLPLT